MDIDPALATMAARLAELAATNASAAVYTKVHAIKARKIDQQTVNELNEIVDDLLSENADLLAIGRAYEEQLVYQRISDKEIAYITEHVIPVLKELIEKAGNGGDAEGARKMEEGLNLLAPLLSKETLTVLQLVGFNFKRAIGEPLTLLLQKLITSQMRPDPQSVLENTRLSLELNLALANIAQDEEASERLRQVLAAWRAGSESSA